MWMLAQLAQARMSKTKARISDCPSSTQGGLNYKVIISNISPPFCQSETPGHGFVRQFIFRMSKCLFMQPDFFVCVHCRGHNHNRDCQQ